MAHIFVASDAKGSLAKGLHGGWRFQHTGGGRGRRGGSLNIGIKGLGLRV